MNEPVKYLIKNSHSWVCQRCFKTHEFLTRGCVPLLFNRPDEIMLVKRWREQLDELTDDLNLDSLPVGTIVPVTPREAQAIAARLAASGDGPPVLTRTIFA